MRIANLSDSREDDGMRMPDWRKLTYADGILPEPIPDEERLVFWLPEERQQGSRCWERIATVAGGKISLEQGISAVAAVSIRARRLGFFDRLRHGLRPGSAGQVWTLPNGQSLEQVGGRRNDLVLAWADDEGVGIDEARIKTRWPQSQGSQKIAGNLFLVRGVEPPAEKAAAGAIPTPSVGIPPALESPVQLAEQMLAAARRSQDNRKIASALTDLGIVLTRQGHAEKAIPLLEEALTVVRQLGDKAAESDVLDNLALAALAARQPQRALELFQKGLEDARASGDRFAEKMALGHLGMAYSAMRDAPRAFAILDQALAIARQVGDRQHEADLLLQLGITHAEAGQRDQAVARSHEALEVFRQMRNPQADWLEGQLQKYRAGEVGSLWTGAAGTGSSPFFGGQIVTSGWTEQGIVTGQTPGAGPGLLRMAFSFMKSMAHFAGAGFKPTSNEVYQQRLQTCGPCEHHTGLRCKVCGCFTSVKARMPHESCPIGKW
jgi:tetratricopeptide (TPR) repeat protein